MLNKKDEANSSHSTRPEKSGAASAFSSYGFGPLDLPDGENRTSADGTTTKPVSGTSSISAISGGTSAGWLAQLAASVTPR
ncbi:MAG: hypothetical protein HY055_14705 [Magnetospirillum sp.]|nr:hypothetical protein [Magnetospirillum sp.]